MGNIAPHEGEEVRLVLAGTKPFATIERSKDISGFARAIALGGTGMLYTTVGPTDDDPHGEVALTLPINRHLMQRYYDLLEYGVELYGIKEYHRQMGKLFGYTEDDVESFINEKIHCNCTKCRGSK